MFLARPAGVSNLGQLGYLSAEEDYESYTTFVIGGKAAGVGQIEHIERIWWRHVCRLS